jgi:uncharacterized protein (DUF302 family)
MNMLRRLFILLALLPFSVLADEGLMVEKSSPLGFDETLEKLIENGKYLGWKLPKSWRKDFQKNLMKVTDEDIGKGQVVEMCEPYAAVKLLKHDKYKKFLSMMPCSVAVYEKSDGKVYLSMMNIQMMGQMYQGEKEIEALVNELGPQMEKMLDMSLKTD